MSVPVHILRNARHPQRPRFCAFDDLQTSLLLSLFLRFRDVYNVDKKLLAKVLYDEVVCDLESVSSYTKEKQFLKQECVQFSLDNVTKLLEHFASFDNTLLRSLDEQYVDKVSSGSGTSGTLFRVIVLPRISQCLFCPSSALSVKVKTHKVGYKAPGGYSWAYALGSGARIAAVCEARCPQCETVYKLQTYTPGSKILEQSGASLQSHVVECLMC